MPCPRVLRRLCHGVYDRLTLFWVVCQMNEMPNGHIIKEIRVLKEARISFKMTSCAHAESPSILDL